MSDQEKCDDEAAGYDGMFGVYCALPKGHEGLHCDGDIEWRRVATEFTSYGRPLNPRHECVEGLAK